MTANPFSKIHVLVLRDELPAVGFQADAQEDTAELLADEPRLRITLGRAGYGEGVQAAEKHKPDLIVIDRILGDPVGLVAELDEALHRLPVLVILDEAERDRVHDCVVAGASAALARPLDPNVLARTIFQVHERAARRRKQWQAELAAGGNKAQGGKLIAIRGTKGGVGATVLSVNLATAVRRRTRSRVALLDAHFFGGDVPVALNVVPSGTIDDVIRHLHVLDDELLERTVVVHKSGVAVLAAPSEFEQAEGIKAEQFQRVLEAMRARYDYVIVDCSPFLDQNTLTAMDLADLLLVVSTPEIVALKNAARLIQLGADLGYSEAKLRLVINRWKCAGAVSRADFEQHLEYPTSFTIPNDTSVRQALMRGEPLSTYHRRSRAARAIDRLADTLATNQGWLGEQPPRRRLLRLPAFPKLLHSRILGRGTQRI